jgi:elongation factor P--beta-lysine ligase
VVVGRGQRHHLADPEQREGAGGHRAVLGRVVEGALGQDQALAGEQARRFAADLATRRARGLPGRDVDRDFLAALASGLPACAGVALGFDRVVMIATGARTIDEVVAFPIERA